MDIRKFLLPAVFGLVLLAGCEEESEPNNNQGVDNFNVFIPHPTTKEMKQGESSEVTAEVRKSYAYDTHVVGYNDGPSDRISVYADDVKIGSYNTQAIKKGGRGWYISQSSPTFRFIPSNDVVRLKVHIDSADSYGTSPRRFYVNRVIEDE